MLTTELESKYVLIDDVNIHYMSAGPTSNDNTVGSTFIFLHGFPEYWQAWQSQLDYFSVNHQVIAPDLPGYNLSDKPDDVSFFKTSHLIELG